MSVLVCRYKKSFRSSNYSKHQSKCLFCFFIHIRLWRWRTATTKKLILGNIYLAVFNKNRHFIYKAQTMRKEKKKKADNLHEKYVISHNFCHIFFVVTIVFGSTECHALVFCMWERERESFGKYLRTNWPFNRKIGEWMEFNRHKICIYL